MHALRLTLTLAALTSIAHAGPAPFSAFAGDNMDSFEGIATPLPFPNFGVDGIRGPTGAGFMTGQGLVVQNSDHVYINDWIHGRANISSTGVSINSAGDVIDGTAYLFTYNSVGRVMIDLPFPATRWGAHMGGNGVQNTTFEMYLGGMLVDSFTTTGLTDFNSFTGWQSGSMFDRIEWNGNHAGFDLFSFDGSLAPPPTCTVTGPAMQVVGDATIVLDAMSMSAGMVDATFEFSLDAGMTWTTCTAAVASTIGNPALGIPTGMSTFIWDTDVDAVAQMAPEPSVLVRVTVDDGVASSTGECTTLPFAVDNSMLCQMTCGDCDTNGSNPDILDALFAAQIAAGLQMPTPPQMGCCDVDSTGSITVLDALAIAQSAAGLPSTLTCP